LDGAFSGRSAVVTGASSGIGRALALELAVGGCRVGLIARRAPELAAAVAEVRAAGGRAEFAEADVGDRGEVQRAFAALAEAHGPADLLVANAGLGRATTLDPVNIEVVEATFRVNLMGVVYAVEAALPAMLAKGTGHLAAVSSLMAYKGFPGESAYCASKAAVNAYLEGLRVPCRWRGLAVTTICPGYVRTPMTAANAFPMPFVVDADEAARRIVRALARRRKVYDFPMPMALAVKASRWLPDWAVDAAFRRLFQDPPAKGG